MAKPKTAKPPKPSAPAAAGTSVWEIYQSALQAQRSGDLQAAREGYLKVLRANPQDFDVLHMLGVLETQQKNYPEALRLLNEALKLDPESAPVLNNIGVALCGAGRHLEGMQSMQRALQIEPDFADACANMGRALCDTGRLAEAIPFYDRALALEPEMADMHYQRAVALDRLMRRDEALAAYERVTELNPGHAEAHCKRGHLLAHAKRFRDALVSYDRAIAAKNDYAEAHCNRGNMLRLLGHLQEALASVDRALALQPEVAQAHRIRGVVLMGLAKYAQALESFDRALALNPKLIEAINDRGNALRLLGRLQEAVAAQEEAVRLAPNASAAYANRAVALMDIGRPAEALADMQRALELAPDNAEFWNLRGNALQALNRHAEAVAAYEHSLKLAPDYAQPEFNISMCRLVRGEFADGWRGYEARWRTGQRLGFIKFHKPLWQGERVQGRILAWGEQGIGDQIFHLSMLESLRQRAPNLLLAVAPRLMPLAERSFPGVRFVPLARAQRERCEVQVPLGSIGRYVRRSWHEFPRDRSAYLYADLAKVQQLRARLGDGRQPVIGLSWLSRAERFGELKSLSLRALEPLLGRPGLRFVDIQYGNTDAERAAVCAALGIAIERLPDVDPYNDMDALAALIRACDLIVTTSNTTAHLAGALGAPTLLMLPYASGRHWYWHEQRSDSPWYPSMRLFRQQAVGDWSDVVAAVAAEVAARFPGA
jgi:tetratricopeptide (TPR) repeat protein